MPPLPSTSSAADVAASITQRFIAARQAQSAAPFGAAEMRALFRHQMGHFRTFYEDEAALDAARAAMPLDRLHEEALAELQPGEDFFKKLALKAMHWFKHEFFQWVNAPPCDFCAAAPEQMKALGMAAPLPEELEHGASRVELYQCQVCSSHSRFPRYNNPVKLLQTRRGRCGEWANCFCLCLRALGFDARYVLDSTDHVWCEIHVEEDGGRYVHMDPCENAWDTPLVYEKGWGKKLSYIFAFTHRSVTDVIKKYSRNWDDVVTRRTKCSESTLEALVKSTNDEALNGVKDAGEIRKRRDQDIAHFEAAFRAGNADVKAEEMVGRESGSLEWRLARGELGGDDGASTGEPSSCPNPDTMDTIFEIPVRASEDDSGTMVVCNGTATFSRLHGPTPFSNHPIFSIQLTDAVNDSKGSAFALPQLPVNKSWLVEFGFRITNPRGGPVQGGADGFAFVLHGDDEAGPMALGGGGYEMGYGGLRACLAVEFDTYQSSDHSLDPNDNHVAIMSMRDSTLSIRAHHRYAVQTATKLPRLNDGTVYYCRVAFDSTDSKLAVWLTDSSEDPNTCTIEGNEQCSPMAANGSETANRELKLRGRQFVKILDTKVDLPLWIGSHDVCYVGFAAATGGLNQRHEICGWRMYSK